MVGKIAHVRNVRGNGIGWQKIPTGNGSQLIYVAVAVVNQSVAVLVRRLHMTENMRGIMLLLIA